MEAKSDQSSAYEARADSIFSFLQKTFSQMPKTVQVIGWLILLLLFVFIVLHPIIGITYFEGRVTTLTFNSERTAISRPEQNLRVERGRHTFTNERGQFIIPARVPYVPFIDVEFDFGSNEIQELVSLPRPIPFISLFNPNESKIYYVPSSKKLGPLGTPQRFFVDAAEAREAFEEKSKKSTPTQPSSTSLLRRLTPFSDAFAAAKRWDLPTHTLRIDELLLNTGQSVHEVYFEILVDGSSLNVDGVPNASSRKIDHITIFSGVPFKSDVLDIPLIGNEHRVELKVWSASFFKDHQLGSVVFELDQNRVGQEFREIGERLELKLQLFPPVSLNSVSVPATDGSTLMTISWIDVPQEYLGSIERVKYDRGGDFATRFENITKQDRLSNTPRFRYAFVVKAPVNLTAEIWFELGTVKLGRTVGLESTRADSPIGLYFLAGALNLTGQHKKALDTMELALVGAKSTDLVNMFTQKAIILGDMKRFKDAIEAFEKVLELDSKYALAINSYAWLLIEKLPNPTLVQLHRGKELAELAVKIESSLPRLDTLGWVYFKLGRYEEAERILTKARDLYTDHHDSLWIELQYHLGIIHLAMGDVRQAGLELTEASKKAKLFSGYPYILELGKKAEGLLASHSDTLDQP